MANHIKNSKLKLVPTNFTPPHDLIKGTDIKSRTEAYNKASMDIITAGLNNVTNFDRMPTREMLYLDEMVPLESNRVVDMKWAFKRLKAKGGLDMIAFGVLYVARDKAQKLHVWDGCGRMVLASLAEAGNTKNRWPCNVYNMEKEEASEYFAYNQDEGCRALTKEAIYVNKFFANDPIAVDLAGILSYLNMYIQGDTHVTVPENKTPSDSEVSWRAITEAMKIVSLSPMEWTNNTLVALPKISILKQARDMIYTAFPDSSTSTLCARITQDLFWAIVQLLVDFPRLQDSMNETVKHIQAWLNLCGATSTQKQVTDAWRNTEALKGRTASDYVTDLLARALAREFYKAKQCSKNDKRVVRYKNV